jgi:hypothetical protein
VSGKYWALWMDSMFMWHASTGEFLCYEPNGDLRGPDSVNVQNAEVIFCR